MAEPDPQRGAVDADFFDDDYLRILEPFHPESGAREETAALRELVGLAQSDRVLDLGCGWGRHLRLLARAGHDVVGVDLSLALLRRAREGDLRDARGDGPALVAGDMLRLPFADATFDVVINVATSLGLFLTDPPAEAALAEARRALRPDGRLLIEGMHKDDVVANFATRDAWTLEDGTEVWARRRFDAVAAVSHEVLRWSGPMGTGTKRHSLRVRSAEEVTALVEAAGLAVDAVYGGWTGESFEPESERLIVVASRPPR